MNRLAVRSSAAGVEISVPVMNCCHSAWWVLVAVSICARRRALVPP
jgi:hypothetical protein